MQFISAKPLIKAFQKDTFKIDSCGPYFILYVFLGTLAATLPSENYTVWDFATLLSSIILNIFGVLYIKQRNSDTWGNHFFAKYFTLGWVTTVRTTLIFIPAFIFLLTIAAIFGGDQAYAPATTMGTIIFEVFYYWHLGVLYVQSQPLIATPNSTTTDAA